MSPVGDAAGSEAATAWQIEPGRGAGPLRIGMPADAAIRVLEATGLGPVERSSKASAPVYASRSWCVLVYPGAVVPEVPETVAEIELMPPVQVQLFDQPLLQQPLADAERFLRSVDARTERRGGLVEAPRLGVRLWSGGDPPDWPVSSVSITRPVPPAVVLAADFSFAELDRLVRGHGFDGGPATVRAPLLAGEPELAEWRRRQVLLRYSFDPVTFLRVLQVDGSEVEGGEADHVPAVGKLLARVPKLEAEQVLAELDSSDEVTCLRAIQAVSVLRLGQARDRLSRLGSQGPAVLRTAALQTLIGLPDPPPSG